MPCHVDAWLGRIPACLEKTLAPQEFIFEVDGKKGHSSHRGRTRDKFRDRVHWEYQRLPTVRLERPWLAGRGKVTDDDIWIEIIWQLKTKYKMGIG